MRLKRYFSVIYHSENNLELRNGAFNSISHFLNDDSDSGILSKIVRHLDGRELSEVAKIAEVTRAQVEGVVDQLIQLGAVESISNSALDAYYDTVIPSLREQEANLNPSHPVTLIGDDKITASIAESLLEFCPTLDLEIVKSDDARIETLKKTKLDDFDKALASEGLASSYSWLSGRLMIVAQEHINPHFALILNRLSLLVKAPMLWGAQDGPALFVGPLSLPEASACYQCFETRLMMNLREYETYQNYKNALADGRVQKQALPMAKALRDIAAGHLAMEAVNYLLTGTAFTVNKTLCMYLPSMEFTFNEVLKVPNCSACGPKTFVNEPELYYDIRAVLSHGENA